MPDKSKEQNGVLPDETEKTENVLADIIVARRLIKGPLHGERYSFRDSKKVIHRVTFRNNVARVKGVSRGMGQIRAEFSGPAEGGVELVTITPSAVVKSKFVIPPGETGLKDGRRVNV